MTEELKQAGNIQIVAALQFASTVSQFSFGLATQTRIGTDNMFAMGSAMNSLISVITRLGSSILWVIEKTQGLGDDFSIIATSINKKMIDSINVAIDKQTLDVSGAINTAQKAQGGGGLVGVLKGLDVSQFIEGLTSPFRTGIAGFRAGKAGGGGLKGGIKGMLGSGMTGVVGKGLMGGLAAMGPQMLALSLIMKPIGALLEGLLAPLEPIIDLFGMVGEILGLLLVPIVQALMEVLLPFMPLLIEIVMSMMPLIKLFMIPLRLLGVLLTAILPIFTQITGVFGDLMQFFGIFADFFVGFFANIGNFVGTFITRAGEWLRSGIQDFIDKIRNWFQTIWSNMRDWFAELIDDIQFWKR